MRAFFSLFFPRSGLVFSVTVSNSLFVFVLPFILCILLLRRPVCFTQKLLFFFSKMVYVCFYLLGIFVNSSDNLFHVCLPLPVETFLRWLLSSSSLLIPTTPDACVCTYREWRVFHFLNLFFFSCFY